MSNLKKGRGCGHRRIAPVPSAAKIAYPYNSVPTHERDKRNAYRRLQNVYRVGMTTSYIPEIPKKKRRSESCRGVVYRGDTRSAVRRSKIYSIDVVRSRCRLVIFSSNILQKYYLYRLAAPAVLCPIIEIQLIL